MFKTEDRSSALLRTKIKKFLVFRCENYLEVNDRSNLYIIKQIEVLIPFLECQFFAIPYGIGAMTHPLAKIDDAAICR